jgi:hypothetical protein
MRKKGKKRKEEVEIAFHPTWNVIVVSFILLAQQLKIYRSWEELITSRQDRFICNITSYYPESKDSYSSTNNQSIIRNFNQNSKRKKITNSMASYLFLNRKCIITIQCRNGEDNH